MDTGPIEQQIVAAEEGVAKKPPKLPPEAEYERGSSELGEDNPNTTSLPFGLQGPSFRYGLLNEEEKEKIAKEEQTEADIATMINSEGIIIDPTCFSSPKQNNLVMMIFMMKKQTWRSLFKRAFK